MRRFLIGYEGQFPTATQYWEGEAASEQEALEKAWHESGLWDSAKTFNVVYVEEVPTYE